MQYVVAYRPKSGGLGRTLYFAAVNNGFPFATVVTAEDLGEARRFDLWADAAVIAQRHSLPDSPDGTDMEYYFEAGVVVPVETVVAYREAERPREDA